MSGFKFESLDLKGAYLITCFSSSDLRGGFTKIFEKEIFNEAGIKFLLNESFLSISAKNVIRGLHFQMKNSQSKLICVPYGKIYDVIVDLRKNSPTFKEWRGFELSAENKKALLIPKGFAHGFASLIDDTIVLYQCDGAYDKDSDTGIRFDDPDIGIVWPVRKKEVINSKRDSQLMSLIEYIDLQTYQ